MNSAKAERYHIEVTSLEVRCLDWVVEIVKDIAVWHTPALLPCETLFLLLNVDLKFVY